MTINDSNRALETRTDQVDVPGGCFVDGRWLTASEGPPLRVHDPADGRLIAELPSAGAAQTAAAVHAAAAAYPAWSALSAAQRGEPLRRAHALLLERADDLALVMTREQGKPLSEARGEVLWGAEYLLWYAEEIRRSQGVTVPGDGPGHRIEVRRRPRGVVACITPWNFPSAMLLRKLAPALAAGNTVVAKPAEQTPLSAIKIFEVLEEAGLPAGVANLVCGDPVVVGDALCGAAEVRHISFTGSKQVGRMLLGRGAGQLKKVTVELGGVAPFVVFADADLELAVGKLMDAKFANAGQSCVAPNRLLVQREVADELSERLCARVSALELGNGSADGTEVGPLIDTAAVAKVRRHLSDALAGGGRVLSGGSPTVGLSEDRFFTPTVLTDVPNGALVLREETFGPLLPLEQFTDEAAVLSTANASEAGLGAYVFTRDLGRAHRMAEALEYGMVAVNDASFGYVQAPFGGIKASGDGREGGQDGLREYQDLQYLNINF